MVSVIIMSLSLHIFLWHYSYYLSGMVIRALLLQRSADIVISVNEDNGIVCESIRK